jgi:hypothetical protein
MTSHTYSKPLVSVLVNVDQESTEPSILEKLQSFLAIPLIVNKWLSTPCYSSEENTILSEKVYTIFKNGFASSDHLFSSEHLDIPSLTQLDQLLEGDYSVFAGACFIDFKGNKIDIFGNPYIFQDLPDCSLEPGNIIIRRYPGDYIIEDFSFQVIKENVICGIERVEYIDDYYGYQPRDMPDFEE